MSNFTTTPNAAIGTDGVDLILNADAKAIQFNPMLSETLHLQTDRGEDKTSGLVWDFSSIWHFF